MLIDAQLLYKNLEKSLAEGSFPSCYFYFGEEVYLVEQALKWTESYALGSGLRDFNFSSYHAFEMDMQKISDEAETMPMMSDKRVIVIKDVHDITDKDWETLEGLIESQTQSEHPTCVFILTAQKIDKRKKYYKTLENLAVACEFRKPFDNQIPVWIRRIVSGYALTISDEAIALLHRLAGSLLSEIDSEIRKMRDYLGDRKNIEVSDVQACVKKKYDESVFDLTDSLGSGQTVESLLHLASLCEQGQSEMAIISMVARHFRILTAIKQGLSMGYKNTELAKYASVPSYYVQDYIRQSEKWTFKKLEQVMIYLAQIDKALKSSPVSSSIWLENLVLKIGALSSPKQNIAGLPTAAAGSSLNEGFFN